MTTPNPIDFNTVTTPELIKRGWYLFSKESNLLLCPKTDCKNVPKGTSLTGIGGDVRVKGTNHIDMDTRWGFLTYGVVRTDVGEHWVG